MRPIKNCFNNQIANICTRVFELESLNARIHIFLPEELRNGCQAASFNRGVLVLTTTDSSQATQLRFFKSELRDKLRREAGLYQLTAIDIKIIEKPEFTPKPVKMRRALSKTAEQTLKTLNRELQK